MQITLPIVITIAAIGLFFMAGFGSQHHHADGHEHMYKHVADELDLTQTQFTQFKRNAENIMTKTDALHDTQALMTAFTEQLRQPAMDQTQVNTALQAYLTQWEMALPQIIAEFAEFHAALNDKQREQLATWLEHHENQGHRGRHNHHRQHSAE